MISYRQTAEDLTEADVGALFEGWARPPPAPKRLEILRAAHTVIVARDGDEVVGFVTAISDGVSWAYVTLLEVVPGHRGRGIGAALMRGVLERYEGLYGIDLNCDDDLVPFYERLGMTRLNGMVIRNHAALG